MRLAQFPHDLLRYVPETGQMYWLKDLGKGRIKAGDKAGTQGVDGYCVITINDRGYRRARLAFLWAYGRWPTPTVDHINRKRTDDRLENLREATPGQQGRNKGYSTRRNAGIYERPSLRGPRWVAWFRCNYLGTFATKQAAREARVSAILTDCPP
jgi:hypothetical protein